MKSKRNDRVYAYLVIILATVYCYLTIMGTASVEGFCVLVGYVVKKYLDMMDEDKTTEPKGE